MSDRTAIVIGASGGIGRAVAGRLGQSGMAVAVHYAGNRERAEETADQVLAAGGRALIVSADVADEAQVAAMFDQVDAEFGGVDVVVNTAGIMLLSTLTDLKFDDFDRMHRTNVRGSFVVSQQAARRVRNGGAIVNFSTSITKIALTGYTALRPLADAKHVVYAGMRDLEGRNRQAAAVASAYSNEQAVTLRGRSPWMCRTSRRWIVRSPMCSTKQAVST